MCVVKRKCICYREPTDTCFGLNELASCRTRLTGRYNNKSTVCLICHVAQHYVGSLYIHITVRRYRFLFNNQPDALIIQIYSVIKLYMFRATPLPIIRSLLLYIRYW